MCTRSIEGNMEPFDEENKVTVHHEDGVSEMAKGVKP